MTDQMDKSDKTKRPYSITIICYVLGIVVITTFLNTFRPSLSQTIQRLGLGFTVYQLFSATVSLLSMVGLWLMRKWAAYAYAALLVISQIVLLALGRWSIGSLLISAIILFFIYRDLSKMS